MRKKLVALAMCIVTLLSSCGTAQKKHKSAPELMTPLSINEAYVPVRMGSIGVPNVYVGTVEPEEYCQFYVTPTIVKDIKVKVGDTVKKGDLLAIADNSAAVAVIDDLKKELKSVKDSFELYKKNNARDINELRAQLKEADELFAAQIKTQIAVLNENMNYEAVLEKRKEENLESRIKAQENMLEDVNLYASKSGTVTYVMNTRETNYVYSGNIVAIISDPKKKHIDIKQNVFEYANKGDEQPASYTYVNGVREEIREIPYSNTVLAFSRRNQTYPNVKLECDSIDKLKIGDNLLVYKATDLKENVLIIDKSSIYYDGQEYVYVLDENGDKKRRNIEVGEKDDYYAEVVSGLELGEQVLFQSDETIPVNTWTDTVVMGEYRVENNSIHFRQSDSKTITVSAPYDGEMVDYNPDIRFQIKKGDYICSIKTNIGKAVITEAKFALENVKDEKALSIKEIDNSIAELKKQLAENPYALTMIEDLQAQKVIMAQSYDQQIKDKEEAYNALAKNNDGTGIIKVYASISGDVSTNNLEYIHSIEKDGGLIKITQVGGDNAIFDMQEKSATDDSFIQDISNIPSLNEKIVIEGVGKYETKCIGFGQLSQVYIQLKDKQPYICISNTDSDPNLQFYVDVENKELFAEEKCRAKFLKYDFKDIIRISRDYINLDKNDKPYVWKQDGDSIIRQYIVSMNELETDREAFIIYGLKAGDVIVRGNVK